MHVLSHLHGAVALVAICALLFADEAGVPIPVAPNELLLIVAGVLTQTGALHRWIAYPVFAVVMIAGMLTGYAGARLAGQTALERLVRRVGAGGAYRKVQERLTSAGPAGIAVARLLPGVRPWATLVAGAAGIALPVFLAGALPAVLLWEVAWLTLGIVVGVPATHYLGVFEKLILRGGLLLGMGLIAYVAIRRLRSSGLLTDEYRAIATPLVLVTAVGATACLAAGSLAVLRGALHIRHYGLVDALVVLAVLALSAAIALLRRHPGHRGATTLSAP